MGRKLSKPIWPKKEITYEIRTWGTRLQAADRGQAQEFYMIGISEFTRFSVDKWETLEGLRQVSYA